MNHAERGAPVHIGKVISDAVTFNPRRQAGDALKADSLLHTVGRLFALLEQRHVDYLLVGGVAMLSYVEGRNTEDVGLIMALSSLRQLPEIHVTDQSGFFARGQFEALQIDLLLTDNPLFECVIRNYATVRHFVERDIHCATVEGLMLLKLYALPSLYRQGNFVRVGLYEHDIATLMQAYHPQLQPLFDELAKHLSDSDLAATRTIVAEIQQRIERFGKGMPEQG